jgi:hypothetical protein
MESQDTAAGRYFASLSRALDGLDTYLNDDESPLYKHDLIGAVVTEYLARLRGSLRSWEDRIAFTDKFRISRAESGFPAFQNLLELENDRRDASTRLASLLDEDTIRKEMVDFILTKKAVPAELQKTMAERRYLGSLDTGKHFSPLCLPQTVRVSVNPKTKRPYYVVHWGFYDGTANLPMIYVLSLEDSSADMVETLVEGDKLKRGVDIPLPVEGLLNPSLANQFDDFCDRNSSYSLTLSTIASSLDKDFPTLHPKQLRRFVLGPFYHSEITVNGVIVDQILQKVKRPENQWLLTWTLQEIYSMNEKPGKWGLWGSQPPQEEFFLNTHDLDAARMGVSAYSRHALVPHEAYQAIYAEGQAEAVFAGYETHIISGNKVLRRI